MPLPIPNLDDRRFQDLVDEAKRMIPRYCPEWTDHNVSDPGVTLIELFAWMTEIMIYRLNRVPEKSYITFLELMGVQLEPPMAARTPLTFWLSAPAVETVELPRGAEVAMAQVNSDHSVSFHTDGALLIHPPALLGCLTSQDELRFEDQTWRLRSSDEYFLAFASEPRPGHAFYLGYAQEPSNTIMALTVSGPVEGIGVDPNNPPLAWEAWCREGWVEADLERDSTGGLNREGQVVLHLPPRMVRRVLNGVQGYWLRCRYTLPLPGQPDYSASPRIFAVRSEALGGTVSATHATLIAAEQLGRSSGKPGQRFRVEHRPALPLSSDEAVEVQREDGSWEPWRLCEHFGESAGDDRHFTFDPVSGEVRFGPAIREPSGSERQYGAVPPRGRLIRISGYRYGGGAAGNVGAHTLTVLKTSIPYVDRVTNRFMVTGGHDAETLERAMFRAPRLLRTRFRAVTAEDYEALTRDVSNEVARAHCIQPRAYDPDAALPPGTVQVLVVPAVAHPHGRLTLDQLLPGQELLRDIERFLNERRLLTVALRVEAPTYIAVRVAARIRARPEANPAGVRQEAQRRLELFLNPLVGGSEGAGWPFGRDLYVSEIYAVLQGTPGIAYLESTEMFIEDQATAQTCVAVPAHGLIMSGEHTIEVM